MEKYSKYKDSGVEFVDKIPMNWSVSRLKNLGFLQNGISKGKEYFGSGFPFVSYGNVYNDSIELEKINSLANSTKEEQKLYSVLEGDIFFTRTSETIDEIGISSTSMRTIPKATFSGFVIRLRPKKNIIYKSFAKYFFKGNLNRQFLAKEINIVTRASLSQGILNNLPVLLPSIEEQTQIANYLDAKTTAIDKKVTLLEQKIKHYKTYRKMVINETVTKGLDKTVKFKDSGVNWIGEIPNHWKIKRLKDLSTISTGNKNSEDFDLDGAYAFFVRSPEIKRINSYSFNEEAVLTAGDGDVGKVFHYIKGKFDVHQRVYCIRQFKKDLKAKYLYYYMYSKFYNQAMINNSNSIVNSIRLPLLRNLEIPISKHNEEQQQIANYLDTKTTTIDKIVNNIEAQITMLKELRKTLINEVVTGKVKVTSTSLSHQKASNQPIV
ncbi:Type I restriction-modification system specificity subunit S [Tenacibaculum maritimum]|uniref:restriction endonuclease subunit S n=1 Tax=Tenacibaculum maritimum TaxID=107401 RepID=UPI0012E69861|nr:restriction endonuclease subunit S [Tenacibaculum maritimum]CAA0214394.1 Type I restriction-modification system specificity subunit S [Tenacibaculum maritimum]